MSYDVIQNSTIFFKKILFNSITSNYFLLNIIKIMADNDVLLNAVNECGKESK